MCLLYYHHCVNAYVQMGYIVSYYRQANGGAHESVVPVLI